MHNSDVSADSVEALRRKLRQDDLERKAYRLRQLSQGPIPTGAPCGLSHKEITAWWMYQLPKNARSLSREAVQAIRRSTSNPHRRGRPFKGSEWNTPRDQAENYGISVRSVKIILNMPESALDGFLSHAELNSPAYIRKRLRTLDLPMKP